LFYLQRYGKEMNCKTGFGGFVADQYHPTDKNPGIFSQGLSVVFPSENV